MGVLSRTSTPSRRAGRRTRWRVRRGAGRGSGEADGVCMCLLSCRIQSHKIGALSCMHGQPSVACLLSCSLIWPGRFLLPCLRWPCLASLSAPKPCVSRAWWTPCRLAAVVLSLAVIITAAIVIPMFKPKDVSRW